MTTQKSKSAETLLQWAEWCDQNPLNVWFSCPRASGPAWDAAYDWCEHHAEFVMHTGPDVVLALCFAAAAVEAGDK